MKRTDLLIRILLLVTVSLGGCSAPSPDVLSRVSTVVAEQRSRANDRITAIRLPQSGGGDGFSASGTIEAPALNVGSLLGGRVIRLVVDRGQSVRAGDLIAMLDTTLLDAEIGQAVAARDVAQAQVALLEAGARRADLDVARAAVTQAEAARDAAYIAWLDARALVDAPSELDVRIAATEANLRAAEEQVRASQSAAAAADLEMQLWARTVKSLEEGFDVTLPPIAGGGTRHVDTAPNRLGDARLQWNLASQRAWEAHAKAGATLAGRNAVQQMLADLRSQKSTPLALNAQADAAKSAYDLAASAVATAQANLTVLESGASVEQIAAARAQVSRADAWVYALETRRDQARVLAPQDGRISATHVRAGEVAAPGAAIAEVYRPEEVTLTVYVPATDLGRVELRQEVGVRVDSFPGRVFTGTVTNIGGRAEFTPRNIQTREERGGTVFPVKVSLGNHEELLKPGMPADAHFGKMESGGTGPDEPDLGSSAVPLANSRFSGAIEATETAIVAEMGGRAVAVAAAEGDSVVAGQVVVQLDDREWMARRAEAQAAAAVAHRSGGSPGPASSSRAGRGPERAHERSHPAREAPGTRRPDQRSTHPGRCGRSTDRCRAGTAQGGARAPGERPPGHGE